MPASNRQQGGTPESQQPQGSGQQSARQNVQRYGRDDGRSLQQARGGLVDPLGLGRAGTSPFSIMRRMTEEMDRLFETFGGGAPSTGARNAGSWADLSNPTAWIPQVEMYERDGRLAVDVSLPGVRNEDINVQLEDDAIILSGERQQESERNRDGVYMSEVSYGSFYRVVPLPDGVDVEKATATFRDGVLHIEIPMMQRQRGRRLQVQDNSTASQGSESSRTGGSSQASQASGQASGSSGAQQAASGQATGSSQSSTAPAQQGGASSEGSRSKS
jgi:HSP20 family protein